jgi:hypothetical protein
MSAIKSQPSLTQKSFHISRHNVIKGNEIKFSAFIAEHNLPINVVDHLTELIKCIFASGIESQEASQITCNRTKCTAIINNVLGKTSFEILSEKLRKNKFSFIVDESTDKSGEKDLAIVVRYNDNFKITDEFLALIPTKDATAQNIYNLIKTFFNTHKIPYKKNCGGFGADGANVMMGDKNSVKTLLSRDIPDLFVMKCICHSLALCASYACEKLPNETEKLVRSVYNYMQHSFKRQSEFQEFQIFLNLKPHKMLHPSQTRWLSLNLAVNRILEQFEALKLYFSAEINVSKAPGAEEIYQLLINPVNKLYLQFLEYVLPTFNSANLEFQSEIPKIQYLYSKMSGAYKLLLSYYIKPDYLKNTDVTKLQYRNPSNFLPLENIYLGPKVAIELNNKVLSNAQQHELRKNCLSFYVEAAHQIYKRFSFNSKEAQLIKSLSFLVPSNIAKTDSIGSVAGSFPNIVTDINDLDREFRLLKNSDIDFQVDDVEFWKNVSNIKKGDGTPLFSQLSQFVSILLTLPHSSACVERIFSVINLNKTKLRNRLGVTTLSGLLHSKRLISEDGSQCYNFTISPEILAKHNANMYDS